MTSTLPALFLRSPEDPYPTCPLLMAVYSHVHRSARRFISSKTEMSAAAKKQMQDMWYRQARSNLDRRLSAAEMLKDEGNDKFSEGEYRAALDEYEYALEMFKCVDAYSCTRGMDVCLFRARPSTSLDYCALTPPSSGKA